MDSKTAKDLLSFVNEPSNQKDMEFYANHRIESLKNDLVLAQDIKTVTTLQGQIKEIKRLLTLREEVHNASRNK